MLLLLFICGGVSFLLHWRLVSRPMLLSGTVIDWTTGRPVSGVPVRFKQMNGSSEAATTDTQGRFTAVAPQENRPYLLYAAGPRFGSLLQSTFGRTVAVYTRGERHFGLVVPAIPAPQVSGHVYDEGRTPLPGCLVWALTEGPEEQEPQLREAGVQTTGAQGAFTFTYLGADRYFVLVRCHRYLPGDKKGYDETVFGNWKTRTSWQPTFFPRATSRKGAKPITLLPGQRRNDIDFHLRSVPQYSVQGRVIFSGKTPPQVWPEFSSGYWLDVSALSTDPALTATAPNGESCARHDYGTSFHCDFLSPGSYRLHLTVPTGSGGQEAIVRFR